MQFRLNNDLTKKYYKDVVDKLCEGLFNNFRRKVFNLEPMNAVIIKIDKKLSTIKCQNISKQDLKNCFIY